jgi:hypothetical protein
MSPAALWRSVKIYELCQRIDLRAWKHLSTSHLRLTLLLPHDEQLRLLRLAEEEKWSVAELSERVTAMRKRPVPSRRGSIGAAARRLAKAADDLAQRVELFALNRCSVHEVRDALASVRRTAEVCAQLENAAQLIPVQLPAPES